LTGHDAIKYAISFLLTSYKGSRSRSFNVYWGADILGYLQEPRDEITAQKIKMAIVAAIDRYEPRVRVFPSMVYVTPSNQNNGYIVRITYRLVDTNESSSMSLLIGAS
jgi:phage baseplate assembly protein W